MFKETTCIQQIAVLDVRVAGNVVWWAVNEASLVHSEAKICLLILCMPMTAVIKVKCCVVQPLSPNEKEREKGQDK